MPNFNEILKEVLMSDAKKLSEAGTPDKLVNMLLSSAKPLDTRAKMMVSLFHGGLENPEAMLGVATALLTQAAAAAPAAEVAELKAKYTQALQELEQGPARPATYIAPADGQMPGPKPRAHVVTPDGQERFPFLHPDVTLDDIRMGTTLYLDAKGAVVLGASRWVPQVGQEATFLRRLPGTDRVEVSIRDEPLVLHAAQQVLDAVDEGELVRGNRVLFCPNRQFAFAVVPADGDRKHRFVDNAKIPDIVVGRDIGSPHWCLGWLARRTRLLLFRNDILEKYDVRPRVSLLMTGPSGTGKTLTIKAYLNLFRKMLIEKTGRTDIPSRVIRVKMSEQLSEWLGVSDKNFDRLFSDIQELAAEKVESAEGELVHLPLVVIFEEVEGIARRRSAGDHDGTGGVFDRIIGTLLQRLDDPLDDLSKLPLVFISTSNKPSMIDVAMHRRLGAKVARFNRLDRQGLASVLSKKLKPSYPYVSRNGDAPDQLRRRLIDEVVGHLFGPQSDGPGLVEITLRDGTKLPKHGRDFLSGAVVEQAVSEAIDHLAFLAEQSGRDDVGLNGNCVIAALERQIRSLAENITAYNASDYVDLPDHTHVASVRRLRGAAGHLGRLVAGDDDGDHNSAPHEENGALHEEAGT